MKTRDSRFELLRIISMLFITLHHFSLFGQGWRVDSLIKQNNYSAAWGSFIYFPLGDIGVYIFVLITGYFVGNKQISIKKSVSKTLQVLQEVVFYSALFLILFAIFEPSALIDPKDIMKSILPVSFNHYWFVTAYVLLMLLAPFTNKIVSLLEKNEFRYLIILSTIAGAVFPLLENYVASRIVGLGIIIPPYLIGTYIKKYGLEIKNVTRVGTGLIVVGMAVMYTVIYLDISELHTRETKIHTGLFALMCSVGIFILVLNAKPFFNSTINKLANHMFAVYLITENVFVLYRLWDDFKFKNIDNITEVNILGFFVSLYIMALCVGIDVLRERGKYLLSNFKRVVVRSTDNN